MVFCITSIPCSKQNREHSVFTLQSPLLRIQNMKNFLFLATVLFGFTSLFSPISALEPSFSIPEYQATYTLKWQGMSVGKSIHTVTQKSPGKFSASVESKPNMAILPFDSFEKSDFVIQGQKNYPKLFEYRIKDKGKRKSGLITFDETHKKILKTEGNRSEDLPFSAAIQDKITYIFQLQSDLKNKHHKGPFTYITAEPKGIKTYTFHIMGTEQIQTAMGVIDTVKLEHISPNKKRRTLLWLAKDLQYLLIKLEQIQKGKVVAEAMILNYKHISNDAQ